MNTFRRVVASLATLIILASPLSVSAGSSTSFGKVSPANGDTVRYGKVEFSWTQYPDPNFFFYVIEFYDAEGNLPYIYKTYASGNDRTSISLDLSLTKTFRPGQKYTWQVFANNGGSSQAIADDGRKFRFTTASAR